VALTVRRKDGPLWPTLTLFAGIVLAILAALQSGRLSALSQAQEEAWQLEADAAEAEKRFRTATGGTPWHGYSMLAALTAQVEAVRTALRGLRWQPGELTAEAGPYRVQLDRLTELRRVADVWDSFLPRLTALAAARKAATVDGPALLAHADDLLDGKELDDLDQVPKLEARHRHGNHR
jgi:hypothetical protein